MTNFLKLKRFTFEQLTHALERIKQGSPEENGDILEWLGYDIAEELMLRSGEYLVQEA